MIATTIIAVLVSVSVIGFALWWAGRKAELAQRDPILLRRILVSVATLYIVSGLFFIVEVAIGKAPLQTLGGLPISVIIVWWLLRRARKIRPNSRVTR